MSNSNAIEPPEKRTIRHPSQPSLSLLPDDIIVRCLARVPRMYHLNISWVSKNFRSLVRSPELNRLRSTLNKSSPHVCFEDDDEDHSTFHWFTLNETSTSTEYGLVLNPAPFPSHPMHGSITAVVGSKIFFIGGSREPSTDLWILDTLSGNMTQGPSMSVPREERIASKGVIDGKIYVLGRLHQVEVYDPKAETWELAGHENVWTMSRCSASVEGKVYIVEDDETNVYNPREGEGERMVRMVSQRLSEGGRKEEVTDMPHRVCVVDDVLFVLFIWSWIMWFDTKLKVWRRLVGPDGKELFISHAGAMSEYDGRLVVFYYNDTTDGSWDVNQVDNTLTKSVECMLVSLDRIGEKICGTIDWSGIVASVPFCFDFLHCLAVSE